ncbi:putative methylated-DNA:protein-cysteine methyltransferase [Catellatospora methionotrophica]|uniref:Putative methylated-DNA:protein-cysteine methyltransferase n=1 Tax=Catellatospora methionotrophica TaxID=121620 RepID=A0A8J3LCL3_9ACTN|nr:methylated-DNA--[protein]-cysteine S-methyltransferase [Catellatospora methionotrophica]GIG15974.1 putative methylated-DNA:protein-cysteine methyltransferase [Catellatospora methionotrophica]
MITIETPAGPFTMTGDGTAVTAAAFDTTLPSVWAAPGEVPAAAVAAVRAYFGGDLAALDGVAVSQHGPAYLEQCWDMLRTLDGPVSYRRLAELTGRPAAVRAAAQGCARNQIALIVPCHRVLRTDGSLGGYRWGLDVKRWLLEHESAHR